jgi:deazaflavin-dependent oxidoreductase (nitroreductase family)
MRSDVGGRPVRNSPPLRGVSAGMTPNWNQNIIEEFRANDGRVGGPFEGHSLVLLHHRGAKSGVERINPAAVQVLDDDHWAIFASKSGAPTNPAWFYNLVANPDAEIELGAERIPVRARVAKGEERGRIWTRQKQLMPGFAEYEKRTTREIPVIVLERR